MILGFKPVMIMYIPAVIVCMFHALFSPLLEINTNSQYLRRTDGVFARIFECFIIKDVDFFTQRRF